MRTPPLSSFTRFSSNMQLQHVEVEVPATLDFGLHSARLSDGSGPATSSSVPSPFTSSAHGVEATQGLRQAEYPERSVAAVSTSQSSNRNLLSEVERWVNDTSVKEIRHQPGVGILQLHGNSLQFKRLYRLLSDMEQRGVDLTSLQAALALVREVGPDTMSGMVGAHLTPGETQWSTTHLNMVKTLDLQLLAHFAILMEDVPVEEWRHMQGVPDETVVDSLRELRCRLYGQSPFPIRLPSLLGPELQVTSLRRQFLVERKTMSSAVSEFHADRDVARSQLGFGKRLWLQWTQVMTPKILKFMDDNLVAEASVLRDLGMSGEVLAVLTCQAVLHALVSPNLTRKEGGVTNKDRKQLGEFSAPFARIVMDVGERVIRERSFMEETSTNKRPDQRLIQRMMRLGHFSDKMTVAGPVGAVLVNLLLDVAVFKVTPGGEIVKPHEEGDKDHRTAPAILHRYHQTSQKKVGYLVLDSRLGSQLISRKDEFTSFFTRSCQPMVTEPLPWNPSVRQPTGGYLLHKSLFVRQWDGSSSNLRHYDTNRIARVMDAIGNVPWKVNGRILSCMEEVWENSLEIGDVPPTTIPDVPKLNLPASLDEKERQGRVLQHMVATRRAASMRSSLPSFLQKLTVARDFRHAPRIFFPHNMDFRGRSYPICSNLNHISNDISRGLLTFAERKPVDAEGLFWMKVSLANLIGKDKLPFEERVAYIDASRDWILEVAKNPLHESNRGKWQDADDGPWQALAHIFELADAWNSGPGETIWSSVPVKMDGSCNGMQHYAALGRDTWGARSVNVIPSDKPQDVYDEVLTLVRQKVADHAASVGEHQEIAALLVSLNALSRKVVKRNVMTVPYGVTRNGAKDQVREQLEKEISDRVPPEQIARLSMYLSKIVLNSVDEIFESAMKIKRWFDDVSKISNGLGIPVSWISPIGLACTQPYSKTSSIILQSTRQSVSFQVQSGVGTDKKAQKAGFPPNFIHSIDAAHMMMVAEECQSEKLRFVAVHDSFWTHAADGAKLARIISSKFADLHERPLLENFKRDLEVQLGVHADLIPELPMPGDLDIQVARKSIYMFD
uniref:DNA-directed RNA polymerase n=1 Tax=Noctiluca scintillans TaxID=2966 RepID=A0A7S1FF35_NOCSC